VLKCNLLMAGVVSWCQVVSDDNRYSSGASWWQVLSIMRCVVTQVPSFINRNFLGEFHDQGDAKWIVIRGQLGGWVPNP
jgi:hypothetical protein